MFKRLLTLLGGAVLVCAIALTPAFSEGLAPLPLTDAAAIADRFYQNPLGIDNIGDPFILPEGDKYYVFATGAAIGMYTWSSDDLVNFAGRKKALQRLSWATGDYWAPEVYAYQDRYVMVFSARRGEDKSLRAAIAFADKPQGPYKDPLNAPLFDFGYAVIDASLFVDDDGTPYLYYVRDCSENIVGAYHESHSYVVQLAPDLLSTVGEPVKLIEPDQAWELDAGGDYRWNEGPIVVKHDGRYYLYYSAHFFAQKEYGVGVAVSDSPMGPFVKAQNNPLLTWVEEDGKVVISGPGHNSFFTIGDELLTAYHTHTYPQMPNGNRQLNYDRAGFHADGTAFINGPTRAPQLLPYGLLNVMNVAPQAKVSSNGQNPEGLVDGDYCVAPASAAYAFYGKEAKLTFDAPVMADSVILYPGPGEAAKGKLVINGAYETPIDLAAALDTPGGSLVIPFEKMALTSVELLLDADAALGEIIILADK